MGRLLDKVWDSLCTTDPDVGSNDTKFVDFNSLEIVGRNWKQKCLSGEYRPYKSFPASPIVGVPECSLLAVDSTDLKFKMRLNIWAARYLWKCVVSEASSSLASWRQPRWAVKAPAQDQSLGWQGRNHHSRTPSMSRTFPLFSLMYCKPICF